MTARPPLLPQLHLQYSDIVSVDPRRPSPIARSSRRDF